ncbi:polyphosphate--glucose phosphotransferase [Nocardioides litoris]|uniref:polyphosphate--glucose phosphotransferase n=1 Tax=Nocardioides litoris TaxID=1926648 RepID=UPI001124BBC0|nr:ROK family protein [Nocardioides litoris]
MSHPDHPLGVDFGGSGIKAAPVDLERGDFAADRERIPTPDPSTPEAVAEVLAELVSSFEGHGPVGVTVPGVVRDGVVSTAANIDDSWIGTDAAAVFGRATGRAVVALNDADAAGLAESRYGAARGQHGLVVVTTLGTGIGSALLHDGVLVPNSELGHVEIDGHDAEQWTANKVREDEDLSWEEWAERLTVYYRTIEGLLSPSMFVVGGGVSKHADKFLPMIGIDTPIIPAVLRNKAGIVGAALHAAGEG